jgi:hypothetical protein
VTCCPAGTLRLGVNITTVQRPAAGSDGAVLIEYTTQGAAAVLTPVRCGVLINTAAQTLTNLAYMQPDADETRLFARVRTNAFFSTALLVEPKLPTGGYFVLPPGDAGFPAGEESAAGNATRPMGRPVLPLLSSLADQWPYRGNITLLTTISPGAALRPPGVPFRAAPGLAVAYSYSDVDVTADAVAAQAAKSLSGSKRRATAKKVYAWPDYFPRVAEADLRGGWFEQLEGMQGRRRTYIPRGWTAHNVERRGRAAQRAGAGGAPLLSYEALQCETRAASQARTSSAIICDLRSAARRRAPRRTRPAQHLSPAQAWVHQRHW